MKRRDFLKAVAGSPLVLTATGFPATKPVKAEKPMEPRRGLSFCEELGVADIEDGSLKEVMRQIMPITSRCARENNFSIPTKNVLVDRWLKIK